MLRCCFVKNLFIVFFCHYNVVLLHSKDIKQGEYSLKSVKQFESDARTRNIWITFEIGDLNVATLG